MTMLPENEKILSEVPRGAIDSSNLTNAETAKCLTALAIAGDFNIPVEDMDEWTARNVFIVARHGWFRRLVGLWAKGDLNNERLILVTLKDNALRASVKEQP